MQANVQRIHRMLNSYFSLGNRAETVEGAVVVTNPEFPLLSEANLIHSVRLGQHQEPDGFLRQALGRLRDVGCQRSHVMVDPRTAPEDLTDRLEAAGFTGRKWVGAAYTSAPQGEGHARVEVRGIAEKSTWGQFSELRREILAAEGMGGEELDQLAALVRRRSLSSNVRYHLALLDFEPVGHIGLLSIGRTGMLVDLAVRPERRRCGLARALIRKMVEQSRTLGHDLSCVVYEDREDLGALFRTTGFEAVSTYTSYTIDTPPDLPGPPEDQTGPEEPEKE
jgi:ribosomal protein S18 acetylase RimI-like enzyme